MILAVTLAFAWLTGFCVVRLLMPAPVRLSLHNVLLFSLGAGVGMGIASCLYFLSLVLFGGKLVPLVSLEAGVLVVVLALNVILKRRSNELDWAPGPEVPRYLVALFLFAVAISVTMFILSAINKPHGEWDAWSIWNLRARFLERAGDAWRATFSNQVPWTHPDYPLLLPGIVALSWKLMGAELTAAPIGIAFLFTFAGAGLLVSTVGILRGKAQAMVAGILLLGTVAFIEVGGTQYADIPLSFFMLAALALLCLADRFPENRAYLVLAGFTAGLAAWTKNEGLLFVVALILARLIAMFRYGSRPLLGPQLLRFAAGLAPPLAIVAFFKLTLAPPNDLMSQKLGDIAANAAVFARWMMTIEGFVKDLYIFSRFLIPIVLVLAVYWFLVRTHVEERDRVSVGTVALAVGLMLAGDCLVYVLLSRDIVLQINSTMDRIHLQVWPAALLAFFLAMSPPQLVRKIEPVKAKPEKRPGKAKRRAAEAR